MTGRLVQAVLDIIISFYIQCENYSVNLGVKIL